MLSKRPRRRFVSQRLRLPKTHDLAYLLDLLPASVPAPLLELPTLSRYAVQHRYPGEDSPVTQRHRKRAVLLAEQAVSWAARHVATVHLGKDR